MKINPEKRRVPLIVLIILIIIVLLCAGGLVYYMVFYRIPPDAEVGIGIIAQEPGMAEGSIQDNMPNEDGKYEEQNLYYKMVNGLQDLTPGVQYIENQVVCIEKNKRKAKAVANRIGGELLSYSDGTGVIAIDEKVYDLMLRLAAIDETDFIVSPNYIYLIN